MLKLLLGDPNARKLQRFQPLVTDINVLEEDIAKFSDDDLRSRTSEFRNRLEKVESFSKQQSILEELPAI